MTPILSSGQEIGNRYRIKKYVNAGGMQEVYLAFDPILERDVALKTPKNTSSEKRFKQSAVNSAKVNHPNVAKVLDYFEIENNAYLIEEFVNGPSLHQLLEDVFYHFDPYLLAHFGHNMARGLAASHHVDVFHRDLKPHNILVTIVDRLFEFKITDFGISKLVKSEFEKAFKDSDSIQASQTVLGALPYMSPEMIQKSKDAGLPSDIWAFGAILYRLLIGRPPFGTGLSAAADIRHAPLKFDMPIFAQKKQFSSTVGELKDIISKCLEKDPSRRPTADDLVESFGNICYTCFPIQSQSIKSYGVPYDSTGWIFDNNFFHYESFYGSDELITPGQNVAFCITFGNRAFPVIPIKNLFG